jgi:non-ribosomal peptide synthetase component F
VACIEIDDELTFKDFLGKVSDIVLQASAHRFYPCERILNDLDVPLHVLSPVLLNLIPLVNEDLHDFTPFHNAAGSGHFDLHCQMTQYNNGMAFSVNYNLSAYTPERVESLMTEFVSLLEKIAANPEYPVRMPASGEEYASVGGAVRTGI